jgi:hypothetical protein
MNKHGVQHMLLLLLTIVIRLRERDTTDVWGGLRVKALFLVPQKSQLLYTVGTEYEWWMGGGITSVETTNISYHSMHVQ